MRQLRKFCVPEWRGDGDVTGKKKSGEDFMYCAKPRDHCGCLTAAGIQLYAQLETKLRHPGNKVTPWWEPSIRQGMEPPWKPAGIQEIGHRGTQGDRASWNPAAGKLVVRSPSGKPCPRQLFFSG